MAIFESLFPHLRVITLTSITMATYTYYKDAGTVHPRLSEPRLSERKISRATPTLRKPYVSWQLQNLAKWRFPVIKSNAECRKCIDYRRAAGYLQVLGYR